MIKALYADDDILIIDKPAGLAVQPGEGVRVSVLDAVERDFGFRPYLVHRLDKETAGCLVVARSPRAAAAVSAALAERSAEKTYRAVVIGEPEPREGVFRADVRVKGAAVGAETRYRTLEADGELALVEAVLGTGRTHQIRQHFAQAGHPIAGDDKYGDFKRNKALAKTQGIRRLMLYAARLSLTRPVALTVEAEVPPHFAAFYERWGRGAER